MLPPKLNSVLPNAGVFFCERFVNTNIGQCMLKDDLLETAAQNLVPQWEY